MSEKDMEIQQAASNRSVNQSKNCPVQRRNPHTAGKGSAMMQQRGRMVNCQEGMVRVSGQSTKKECEKDCACEDEKICKQKTICEIEDGQVECRTQTVCKYQKPDSVLPSSSGIAQVNCRKLRHFIDQVSFAMDDARLFLDTHPNCREAMAYYKKMEKMRKEAIADYQRNCGPLLAYQASGYCEDGWTWTEGPLPWENDCCNGRRR